MTITLRNGRMVDIYNISPSDIFLEDIAYSLAYQCRFNGHTSRFYSVAEHSKLVCEILSLQDIKGDSAVQILERRMAGLLHDANEAYIGDITAPIMGIVEFSLAPRIEAVQDAIFEAFQVPNDAYDYHAITADFVARTVEGAEFIGGNYWETQLAMARHRHREIVDLAESALSKHYVGAWANPAVAYNTFAASLRGQYSELVTAKAEAGWILQC